MFKSLDLQKTLGKIWDLAIWPLAGLEAEAGGAGRLPASSLAGGEGLGVEEVELT